jgi:hypothetical protein
MTPPSSPSLIPFALIFFNVSVLLDASAPAAAPFLFFPNRVDMIVFFYNISSGIISFLVSLLLLL